MVKLSFAKIDNNLLDLSIDLDNVSLLGVKEVIHSLKSIIQEMQMFIISNKMKQTRKNFDFFDKKKTTSGVCVKCKEIVERNIIQKMKDQVMIPYLFEEKTDNIEPNNQDFMKKFEDEYQAMQVSHIDLLQKTLNEQKMFLLEDKNSLVHDFLIESMREKNTEEIDITDQIMKTRENMKIYSELEQMPAEKFKNRIENKVKQLILGIAFDFLRQKEIEKKKCRIQRQREAEIQTCPVGDITQIDLYKSQIVSLKEEMVRIRNSKFETQKLLLKSVDSQKVLKQRIINLDHEISRYKAKVLCLEERANKVTEKLKQVENYQKENFSKLESERREEKMKIKQKERILQKQLESMKKSSKPMPKTPKLVGSRISIFKQRQSAKEASKDNLTSSVNNTHQDISFSKFKQNFPISAKRKMPRNSFIGNRLTTPARNKSHRVQNNTEYDETQSVNSFQDHIVEHRKQKDLCICTSTINFQACFEPGSDEYKYRILNGPGEDIKNTLGCSIMKSRKSKRMVLRVKSKKPEPSITKIMQFNSINEDYQIMDVESVVEEND